ncbi:MAG TPA: hypothetical protein VFN55_06560 [Solirubrobacteraceae bacterium]|nr:hypothetical protein [Solirubrobacteraceae bacterium]
MSAPHAVRAAGRARVLACAAVAVLAAGIGLSAGAGSPRAGAALPPGCAQSGDLTIFGLSGARRSVAVQMPACATGAVTVSFHSTAAACAAHGPCGYDGTESWTAAPGGELVLVGVGAPGALRITSGSLFAGGLSALRAQVARTSPTGRTAATCRDVGQPFSGLLSVRPHAGRVTIALGAGQAGHAGAPVAPLLGSQCAGPTDGDVGPALPSVTLPVAVIRAGHATIDLSGTHAYASRDFAGTVTSTLVVSTGQARVSPVGRGGAGRGPRRRNLIEHYLLARLDGRLAVAIAGAGDPRRCRALDACGARGRITVALRGRPGASVYLNADGPARRPAADFLAAVGRGSGDPTAIRVTGGGEAPVAGRVIARLTAPARCADSTVVHAVSLMLSGRRGRMQVALVGAFDGGDPLRTRCPGPGSGTRILAAGTVPLSALAGRSTTVILHGRRFEAGPYSVDAAGTITIALRRRATSVQIYRGPF